MTQGNKKDRDLLFEMFSNEKINDIVNQTREMPFSLKKVWLDIQ